MSHASILGCGLIFRKGGIYGHNGTAKMVMPMYNYKGLSSRQLPARTRHCGIRMLAVMCTLFFFALHCSCATGLREMDADGQGCQDASTPSQQPCLMTRHARWSPFAMLLRRRCNAERMNCMLENAVRQTHDRKQLAGLKRDYIDETGTYCGMGGNGCRMHAISFSSLPPQSHQLFAKIITLVLSHFGTNFRSERNSLSGILVLGEIAVLVCMSALALITRASTSTRSRNDDDAHSIRPPSVWEDTSVRKRRRRRRRTEDDDDDDEDERAGAGRGYGRLLLFVFLLIVVECFDDVVEDADDYEDGDDIDVPEANGGMDIKLRYTGEEFVDVKAWAIMCLLARQIYYGTLLWDTVSLGGTRTWEEVARITGIVLKLIFVFAGGVVIE